MNRVIMKKYKGYSTGLYIYGIVIILFFSCKSNSKYEINETILKSLGNKHKTEFTELGNSFAKEIALDSANLEAYLGLADAYILLYVFGYTPREIAIDKAQFAYNKAVRLNAAHSDVHKLDGILHMLDWNWEDSKTAFQKSIAANPNNLNARHWYSLWLSAMGEFKEAMEQSDLIMESDTLDNYLIGRSSLLYFQYRFEEMKPLTLKSIEKNPQEPWAYDWLGMAYNGLDEHEASLETYLKAFELSDGTVEVGGGLGHALGDAGETKLAKQMADFYTEAAKTNYLPPVQRSFIHISLKEFDEAIRLLEQAYDENSWFLIFIQVEHWYDPLRSDQRFIDIMEKMNFPEN